MIAEANLAAVTRAIDKTFGVTHIDDIHKLTIGQSGALVYRITVKGARALLRIVTRTEDPTLPGHFACMCAAATSGLAPRVLYTSIEDRLSITDFVEAKPCEIQQVLREMPATLRALHALQPFPPRADHLNTTCTFLLNKAVATKVLIERIQTEAILPRHLSEELFARYDQLVDAYSSRESDMVSSHNGLFKPDNILFHGHRLWLIDWEAAFLNDRYADLAVVATARPSIPDAPARPCVLRHGLPLHRLTKPPDRLERAPASQ